MGLTVSLLRHLPSLLPVALPLLLLLHVTDRLLMLAVAPGRGLLLLHVILGLLGGGCRNCGGVNGLLHLHLRLLPRPGLALSPGSGSRGHGLGLLDLRLRLLLYAHQLLLHLRGGNPPSHRLPWHPRATHRGRAPHAHRPWAPHRPHRAHEAGGRAPHSRGRHHHPRGRHAVPHISPPREPPAHRTGAGGGTCGRRRGRRRGLGRVAEGDHQPGRVLLTRRF